MFVQNQVKTSSTVLPFEAREIIVLRYLNDLVGYIQMVRPLDKSKVPGLEKSFQIAKQKFYLYLLIYKAKSGLVRIKIHPRFRFPGKKFI